MVFQTLYDSYQRGELLLIDGGFARWRLKKDGSITLYEIFSTKPGNGKQMIETLLQKTTTYIQLKCPTTLKSNGFYAHVGFTCIGQEITQGGNILNIWRKYA